MNFRRYITPAILLTGMLAACEEGIDPVTTVLPGEDKAEPVVTIEYPGEGVKIRVREDVTPIDIRVDVKDDIEIGKIVIYLDEQQLTEITGFKDYRHAVETYRHESLSNGVHVLRVEASDLSGKTGSQSVNFEKIEPYRPLYDGEVYYIPFDGDYLELVSIAEATATGSPGFAEGKIGNAYAGVAGAYLTFETKNMVSPPGAEFSAAFWYKVNATPDRAGILTMSADAPDGVAPDKKNNRNFGFRLFREGNATGQTVKLNVGTGSTDVWFDGGAAARLNPETAGWVHIAFTISPTKCVLYFNGQVVSQGAFAGVSWEGCDFLSIGSGAPRFTEWGHLSDNSLTDELRLFNKELTATEVATLMNATE